MFLSFCTFSRYYKGLGTSTPDEAKQYFSNLKSHLFSFRYNAKVEKKEKKKEEKWILKKQMEIEKESSEKVPAEKDKTIKNKK